MTADNLNMGPPSRIDFDSPVPYYAQLIHMLKNQVARGAWQPGDKIPGEPALCRLYGISRTVVRQALGQLENEGLIERRKGKGTFVVPPRISESLAQKLTGFYQDMVDRGLQPITQVLHQRVVKASEKIAGFLELPPDSPVVDIKRLRLIDNLPVQLVTTYIPYRLCPQLAGVDLSSRSLYTFLEQEAGLFIARGRRFFEAVAAGEQDARLLQVERGAPLIQLESISYLENGDPLEYYYALHRGDRSRFEVELVRTREGENPHEKLNAMAGNLPGSNAILSG